MLLAPAAIRRFRRSYPQVEPRGRSGLYYTLAPLLRDGRLDFIVCPRPADPADAQFSGSRLTHSQMVLVARQGHALAGARNMRRFAPGLVHRGRAAAAAGRRRWPRRCCNRACCASGWRCCR